MRIKGPLVETEEIEVVQVGGRPRVRSKRALVDPDRIRALLRINKDNRSRVSDEIARLRADRDDITEEIDRLRDLLTQTNERED